MSYEEKVKSIAGLWSYKFANKMTREDHIEFRRDCAEAEVEVMDVLEAMED